MGRHHLQEDFARFPWRALVYALLPAGLPSQPDRALHCRPPQHPRATRPGLVPDPTLLLSSPTEAWINRYQKQLVRSISPQFLEEIICYLRRLDLLTVEEAGRVQEASSLPEQVRAVVDVLAGKGSYASQCLQTFIETTNSQLYLHITVYGRQRTGGQDTGCPRARGQEPECPVMCPEPGCDWQLRWAPQPHASAAAGSGPPPASAEEGHSKGVTGALPALRDLPPACSSALPQAAVAFGNGQTGGRASQPL